MSDALQAPHPLAPIHDIARASATAFGPLLDRDVPAATLFGELSYSRSEGESNGPQPRDQANITIRRDYYFRARTGQKIACNGC